MKKLIFTFALALLGFFGYSQQASQLIPTQGLNPKTFTPPNFLYVNQADNRIWPVLADSVRLKYINIRWINDSVIVIADRRYVKLAGSYLNPTFISSLSSSKVTGLSTVATTGDYSDLSNKPNLSLYETASHASSTYQPIGSYYPLMGNPSNFLTSFTEIDPIWSGVSANYRTKTQNDALYKAIGYVPSNSEVISAIGYTPYNSSNPNNYISSIPAQSFASLTGKPTTLSGYGITDAYPLSGNPGGFLTGITSGQVTTALGFTPVTNARTLTINGTAFDLSTNRSWTVGDVTSAGLSSTLSNYVLTSTYTSGLATKEPIITAGTTGQYWRGDKTWQTFPSIPAQFNPSPGVGISITGTYPNITITNTAPDYIPTPTSATRALNSNFTVSTTKQAQVAYSISLSVTNPLLVGTSSAAAYLEYSINAGSTWVPVSDALISSGVGVAVAVAITNTQTQILSGTIPSNALVRIRTTTSGTASLVYVRGQETY